MKLIEDLFNDIENEKDPIAGMLLCKDRLFYLDHGVRGLISKYTGSTIHVSAKEEDFRSGRRTLLGQAIVLIDCSLLPKFVKTISPGTNPHSFCFINQQNLRSKINFDLEGENIDFLDAKDVLKTDMRDVGLVTNANVKGRRVRIFDAKKSTFKCRCLELGSVTSCHKAKDKCLEGCTVDCDTLNIYVDDDLKWNLLKIIKETEKPSLDQFLDIYSKCKLSKNINFFYFYFFGWYSSPIVITKPGYYVNSGNDNVKSLKDDRWVVYYHDN